MNLNFLKIHGIFNLRIATLELMENVAKERKGENAMNEEILQSILKNQMRRYRNIWNHHWEEGKKVIHDLKEKILSGDLTSKEEVYARINTLPKEVKLLFDFIFGVDDSNANEILQSQEFRDFLRKVESIQDYEEIRQDMKDVLDNLKGMGVSSLSTWAAIIKEDMFMPVWGTEKRSGILNKANMQALGITDRFVGGKSDVDYYIDFMKSVKKVSDGLGITNMFEVAYYLSKYTPDDHLGNFYIEISAPPWPGHTGKVLWSPEGSNWGIMNKLKRGDVIIHYRTRRSKQFPKKYVGFSRVKSPVRVVSREKLKDILVKHGIWSEEYEMFSKDWIVANTSFYIVELEDFREFNYKIPYTEIKTRLNLDPPQRYLYEINAKLGKTLIKMGLGEQTIQKKPRNERVLKQFKIIQELLKNRGQTILYGPPGTGKTYIARNFVQQTPPEYVFSKKGLKEGQRFFWWTINPKIWDYTKLKPNVEESMWREGRRLKSAFEEIDVGDFVFIYVGGNIARIYAIGECVSKDDEPTIRVIKLLQGPSWRTMKEDPVLSNSLPVKIGARATLIPLSQVDVERLIDLVGRDNLADIGLFEEQTDERYKSTEFVTFHQSYAYEEFVEGLKPVTDDEGKIWYEVEEGIFKRICRNAFNALLAHCGIEIRWEKDRDVPILSSEDREIVLDALGSNDYPVFYLIIDEINRGDISRIFGELITLLEADKRLFAENELVVTLPYSKKRFGVPPNLYIIGTMNTADRSIALIDVALRRRFGFIELMPDYELLEKELLTDNLDEEVKELRSLAINVLKTMNNRIKELYDRDHQIGHSYFLKLKNYETEEGTIEAMKQIWYYEVLPLLQEYFYDSPDKLKNVLNGKFVNVQDSYFDFKEEDFIEALKEVARSAERR